MSFQNPLSCLRTALEHKRRAVYKQGAYQKLRHFLHVPELKIKKPLFLIGTVRSGTTFFADCLNQHPSIVQVGFELNKEWCDLAHIQIAGPGTPAAHCPLLGEKDATPFVCGRVRKGFSNLLLQKGGWRNSIFFNKSPHLWNKLPFLKTIFPDARLIVISRDIRSTVASTKLLWEKMFHDWGIKHYLPQNSTSCWSCIPPASSEGISIQRIFPGGDVAVIAEYWLRVYETIERNCSLFSSVAIVKHQDFVNEPYIVLKNIYKIFKIPSIHHSLAGRIQEGRNQRSKQILLPEEDKNLELFIETHYPKITALGCVDVT